MCEHRRMLSPSRALRRTTSRLLARAGYVRQGGVHVTDEDPPATATWREDTYRTLYESHGAALPPETAIGGGDYEIMGRIMLSALVDAGLRKDDTFVDFGCGTGRLALHAIPYLSDGAYIGIDIADSMLTHARARFADQPTTCTVRWSRQEGTEFALADQAVDMFAAFSVFTHMEHEDTYRYLLDARRAVRPGGRFVFSCLTMDLDAAWDVFITSASADLSTRWSNVRNVTTSYELMDRISHGAGWRVERWYKGDEELIPLIDVPDRNAALGQSICVLRAG